MKYINSEKVDKNLPDKLTITTKKAIAVYKKLIENKL